MTEKKKTIVDYGLAVLREILKEKANPEPAASKPTKTTLDDLTLDDLKHEEVRLDLEERKMLAELRDLEAQKRKLFEEGVRNASEREQRVIARRVKTIDQRANSKDYVLQAVSKQIQIIEGLVQIKDSARIMNETGLASVISKLDLDELTTYISNSTVDGRFDLGKFNEILRTLGLAEMLAPQMGEDPDVLDIVRQFQMAREAADSPELLEKHYSDFTQQMAQKSRVASGEE